MTTPETAPVPGKRDPEGRRRAIVAAAADLIVETGAASLTHRAVAARAGVSLGSTTAYFGSLAELVETALESLADQIDAELAEIEEQLSPLQDAPERCAAVLHEYLLDQRQVRADLALLTAAMTDATLRPLALRWSDRLTEILARHTDRARAEAIVLYIDGATLDAALRDEPVPAASIAQVLRALLGLPEAGTAEAGTLAARTAVRP